MTDHKFTYRDLRFLYEDNRLLVVVKPYNIPVQPDDSGDPSMYDMLTEYLKEKYNKPGDAFLGIVHRLDRPTGGVMVFARNSKTAKRLGLDILGGYVKKRYFAVVEGIPAEKSKRLESYLAKNSDTNTVRIVSATTDGAKRAVLDYTVLEENRDKNMSLLQVDLLTGRFHQIRVQLSSIGHPIVGDRKYGKPGQTGAMCLWACQLEFDHPVTGQHMVFKAYPPEAGAWQNFNLDKYLSVNAQMQSIQQALTYSTELDGTYIQY